MPGKALTFLHSGPASSVRGFACKVPARSNGVGSPCYRLVSLHTARASREGSRRARSLVQDLMASGSKELARIPSITMPRPVWVAVTPAQVPRPLAGSSRASRQRARHLLDQAAVGAKCRGSER